MLQVRISVSYSLSPISMYMYMHMQACQDTINSGTGLTYVARNTVPAKWTIGSLSPLQFTVVYGDGDKSEGPTLTRCVNLLEK